MANNEPFDIQSDTDLKSAVRTETQYDDGKLPTGDLDGLVQSAKRELAVRAGVTTFYDERGIAVALFGLTCVKAKSAVENSPVVTKNIGPNDVTFRTPDGDSLQVTQYETMVQRGLSDAQSTSAGSQNIEFTRTFLTDESTQRPL